MSIGAYGSEGRVMRSGLSIVGIATLAVFVSTAIAQTPAKEPLRQIWSFDTKG